MLDITTTSGHTFKVPPGLTLRNHVRIYFGDRPLPRFSNEWLYGDLHYHAQGTDNEGESGYSYRGVVRAMGAMGIDFVMATEHASDSEQVVDSDLGCPQGTGQRAEPRFPTGPPGRLNLSFPSRAWSGTWRL